MCSRVLHVQHVMNRVCVCVCVCVRAYEYFIVCVYIRDHECVYRVLRVHVPAVLHHVPRRKAGLIQLRHHEMLSQQLQRLQHLRGVQIHNNECGYYMYTQTQDAVAATTNTCETGTCIYHNVYL